MAPLPPVTLQAPLPPVSPRPPLPPVSLLEPCLLDVQYAFL